MLKHYLLESVIRHYVQNVEQVLQQVSISRLLFGSVRLERVHLVPEAVQDALFSYVFYACEFKRVTALDVEVNLEWLSVATRSVQFRIQNLEVELLLYDPEGPEATPEFWDAQGMRLKAEAEYTRSPAESTLLYKVLGGLDVIANNISVHIHTPGCREPRLLVSLTGFRYCPATQAGVPTNDLGAAMRPDTTLGEVAYNYWLEMSSLAFSLPPEKNETVVARPELAVEGFTFSSFGKVPANGRREAPFYATTVNALEVQRLRADAYEGPMPMKTLLPLAELLSRAWMSDDLRDGRRECTKDAVAERPEQDSWKADLLAFERKNADGVLPLQSEEARSHLQERLLATQQTKSDMADLLAGCSRSSRQRVSSPQGSPKQGTRGPFRSFAEDLDAASGGIDADEDDFKDCEDVCDEEAIEPGERPGSPTGHTARVRECLRQGPLKRFMFYIGGCCLQVAGQDGALIVQFSDFRASTDKRREFSPQEAECMCSLFDMSVPPRDSGKASSSPAGMLYAGVSLATARLAFTAKGENDPADVFNLRHGLKLRHRGSGNVVLLSSGPVQIMEVEAAGLMLGDHGRGPITAMWEALSAVLAPSPSPVPSTVEQPQVGYSLQVLDIRLEAGSPPWRCSLPCLRLSSVLHGLEDLWSYTAWGPQVARGAADPLGSTTVDPAARPWWEPSPRAVRVEAPLQRRGGDESDVIADLEGQLAQEQSKLGAERARASQLEAKLQELIRLLRSWPEGPLPLALQNLLAENSPESTTKPSVAPQVQQGGPPAEPTPQLAHTASSELLPGLQVVTFDLDAGKEKLHPVEGLRRGDAVQWFLEEVQDRTVDVRVVLRSRRKLHAARCLRETERMSRRRDFFEVTEDFGEEQLPLTLEIHLSNAYRFTQLRVRLKLCRVAGGALQDGMLPWPALAAEHPVEET